MTLHLYVNVFDANNIILFINKTLGLTYIELAVIICCNNYLLQE